VRGRRRQLPEDPQLTAELEAIERALSGRPVDPEHAELARLSLLLVAERPAVAPQSAAAIDARVAAAKALPPARRGHRRPRSRRGADRASPAAPGRRRAPALAWGGGLATVIALIVALALTAGGGSRSGSSSSSGRATASSLHTTAKSAASAAATAAPARPSASARAHGSAQTSSPARAGAPSRASSPARTGAPSRAGSPALASAPSSPFGPLAPQANGRQVIESGQLQLTTSPRRVDQVAEEAFRVIGQLDGIVQRSTVNATAAGGYAEIQLSVPEQSLPQAMGELSTLPYASVASRTDASQDVTGSYDADRRALADARALRTSLLKRLADAHTQAQIDSLTAQIHDAEASIASDQATLAGLEHQVAYSSVQLTIAAGRGPFGLPGGSGSGAGFTLSRAAHDAGRVLTVAAGVALIALAVLLPLGLLVALAAWIWLRLRRRGREQALDAA